MRYASVCDGIGAVHVAWQPLGWECAWTSEIDPFPAAVVEHHYRFKNLGDMTKITKEMLDEQGAVDVLVGGTPCQSFSIAGLRGGLADPRGNMALRFVQLASVMQPQWVVWENVPGVLSVGKGRDFGAFLGALGELGYGFAYRVLDAQWFGVAQRRRRVFVVAHLGDWRRAAAVLFERESVFGNHQSLGTQGKETPLDAEASAAMHGGVPYSKAKRAQSSSDDETWKRGDVAPTQNQFDVGDTRATTVVAEIDQRSVIARRLTPKESERLQGFPDNYTAVTFRKKPAADGPRYRALGNSMAVPCMAWLGYRIQKATQEE